MDAVGILPDTAGTAGGRYRACFKKEKENRVPERV